MKQPKIIIPKIGPSESSIDLTVVINDYNDTQEDHESAIAVIKNYGKKEEQNYGGVIKNDFKRYVKEYGYCDTPANKSTGDKNCQSEKNNLSTLNIALIITSSVLFIALIISLFLKGKKGKK